MEFVAASGEGIDASVVLGPSRLTCFLELTKWTSPVLLDNFARWDELDGHAGAGRRPPASSRVAPNRTRKRGRAAGERGERLGASRGSSRTRRCRGGGR